MFEKDFLNTKKKPFLVNMVFDKKSSFILTLILYLCLIWCFSFYTPKDTVTVVSGDFNSTPSISYPGWHFYNPFIETINHYQTTPISIDNIIHGKTLDNQDLAVKVNLSIKINPSEFAHIAKGYSSVDAFKESVLVPALHEIVVNEIKTIKLKSLDDNPETFKTQLSKALNGQFDKTKIRLLYLFVVKIKLDPNK